MSTPDDWDDRTAWNRYFADRIKHDQDPCDGCGPFKTEELPQIASHLLSKGWKSIWVPGCGLSSLPTLLAHVGMTVYATDSSEVAIEYQQSGKFDALTIAPEWKGAESKGKLICEEHDMRSPFRKGEIDLVINVKAFQRFSVRDMRRVALVHFEALKPGRQAIFETLNCQGERRDNLEESLVEAGFVIPFFKIDQAFRRALRATGIPHVFVLGSPVIPQRDDMGNTVTQWFDDEWRNRSTEILRGITLEFRQQMEAAREKEQKAIGPETRLASMIYNTG